MDGKEITDIVIPNNVTEIGECAFYNCSCLTSVTIGNSVSSIGYGAFWNCSGLTSVTIGNSVMSIGSYAFQDCSDLTSVTIGNSVTSLGSCAFSNCDILLEIISKIENPLSINTNTFSNNTFYNATLYVPAGTIDKYKATKGWNKFAFIEEENGGGNEPEPPVLRKCTTPTISYSNGELAFNCDTEGAEFISEITDSDIKKNYTEKIQLSVTYNLTVYATKTEYENSDTIQATLCWIEAEPKTEGIDEDAVTEVRALPVLIQSHGGTISIQGLDAGTLVSIYSTDGKQQGSMVVNGATTIRTSLQPSSIAIVKIGERSIKIPVK